MDTMKKIVTGLASFGMSGKVFHAPILGRHDGYVLKSVVERSKNEAKKIYPDTQSVKSYEDLLNDDEIQLIIVNTPDYTHFEMAMAALEAGKHVVVEKPFTQSFAEAEKLIEKARQKGKMLTVYQNRRFDGDFLTVKLIIEKKTLGRLVEFESHFDRFRNFIQEGTWKEKSEFGAGITYNLGSHMIDQALVLFGTPEAITADIRALRDDSQVDDYYDICLHYPNIKVTLKASYLVREPGPRYILHGTTGSFLKWGIDPQEENLKSGKNPFSPTLGTDSPEYYGTLHSDIHGVTMKGKIETLSGNYPYFYDNIWDHLVEGKSLDVLPEQAALVIKVIEKAFQSKNLRRTIDF
jgi:scyllo-inositol 2-dehydrogenase (NADP+)